MSTPGINFNLRPAKSNVKEETIRVVVRWNKNKFRASTGLRIDPAHWDKKFKQQGIVTNLPAKTSKDERNDVEITREKLAAIKKRIKGIFESLDPEAPTLSEFTALYYKTETQAKVAEKKKVTLLDYIEYTMPYKKFNKGGVVKTLSEVTRGNYRQVGAFLKEYSGYKFGLKDDENGAKVPKRLIDFHEITGEFYIEFVEWMQTKEVYGRKDDTKGHTANTIGKAITNIKSVMNHAVTDPGAPIDKLPFNPKDFTPAKETKMDHIYLTVPELEEMWALKFEESEKHLEKARDLFLVSAWSSLRYSDLIRFNEFADVDREVETITVPTKKTGATVTIPLLDPLPQILDKYENGLPEMPNPKANEYIKIVAKRLKGFNRKMGATRTVGGKKTTTQVVKHDLVMMHTARRSFATNMAHYFGVNPLSVMKITGHTTLKTFENYLKSGEAEAINEITQKVKSKRNEQ